MACGIGIDHALVGTTAIGVDLVKHHRDLTSWGDLGKLVSCLSENSPRAGFKLVIAGTDRLAKGLSRRATEAGGVLLEGTAAGAVTGSGGVDAEGHAGAACVAGCLDDGAMGGDEGEDREEEGEKGGERGRHDEEVRLVFFEEVNKVIEVVKGTLPAGGWKR